jgi:hypothetical protein
MSASPQELIYREPYGEDWQEMSQATSVTFLLRYTDALGWFPRWTCLSYKRGRRSPRWALNDVRYGVLNPGEPRYEKAYAE